MPLTSEVWADFKLKQGTREPGSFRVGKGGGASVLTGTISSENLETILTEGVESATADNTTGKITRILPVAHPRWSWHFLRNVDNAAGVSFIEKVAADPGGYLEVPPLPYYSDYQKYEIQATFEPRPYALISDDSIPQYTINYYTSTGASATKTAFREYYRYIEWTRQPAAEYITAEFGQYVWAGATGTGNHPANPDDNTGITKGQIRVLLPSSTWKIKWHMVPYQYVLSDNTYFDRYCGHVNQAAIFGFAAGEALVQAVNVLDVYSPPFPEFTTYTGYDSVSQDKLCDLEIVIHAVRRTPTVAVTPTNASHIAGGHNCVIYAPNGKAYYAESGRTGSRGSGTPIYPSFPLDLLFQNPDGPA